MIWSGYETICTLICEWNSDEVRADVIISWIITFNANFGCSKSSCVVIRWCIDCEPSPVLTEGISISVGVVIISTKRHSTRRTSIAIKFSYSALLSWTVGSFLICKPKAVISGNCLDARIHRKFNFRNRWQILWHQRVPITIYLGSTEVFITNIVTIFSGITWRITNLSCLRTYLAFSSTWTVASNTSKKVMSIRRIIRT